MLKSGRPFFEEFGDRNVGEACLAPTKRRVGNAPSAIDTDRAGMNCNAVPLQSPVSRSARWAGMGNKYRIPTGFHERRRGRQLGIKNEELGITSCKDAQVTIKHPGINHGG